MGIASELEMGRGGSRGRGGGTGGLLLFTSILYVAVVSEGDAVGPSYTRWYAGTPVHSFNWYSNLYSRFRRDASGQQDSRSHYLKRQGLYGRSQQFQRLMKRDGGR